MTHCTNSFCPLKETCKRSMFHESVNPSDIHLSNIEEYVPHYEAISLLPVITCHYYLHSNNTHLDGTVYVSENNTLVVDFFNID